MNLGDVASDIEFDGTSLHTVAENGAITGDQDAGIQFLGILDPVATDILSMNLASFSLTGVLPDGQGGFSSGNLNLDCSLMIRTNDAAFTNGSSGIVICDCLFSGPR